LILISRENSDRFVDSRKKRVIVLVESENSPLQQSINFMKTIHLSLLSVAVIPLILTGCADGGYVADSGYYGPGYYGPDVSVGYYNGGGGYYHRDYYHGGGGYYHHYASNNHGNYHHAYANNSSHGSNHGSHTSVASTGHTGGGHHTASASAHSGHIH